MDDEFKKLADTMAVLECLIYYLADNKIGKNKISFTVNDALSEISKIKVTEKLSIKSYLRGISEMKKAIANNSKIGEVNISCTTWGNTIFNNYNEGTNACVYKDDKGTIIVAYRGTGDGEWYDNKYAYSGLDSPQQKEALIYFEQVIESLGLKENNKIIVIGHSKGGNKAQYVTLNSKYGSYIDMSFSFDGQGFSKEKVNAIKKRQGEDNYFKQINKVYSICGENDYVNEQGFMKIVKKSNTYYIQTKDAIGFADYHDINYMLKNGSLGKETVQGPFGKLSYKIAKEVSKLPKEERDESAKGMMELLECFMGFNNKFKLSGVNSEEVNAKDILVTLTKGGPAIIKTIVSSDESAKMLWTIIKKSVVDLKKEMGR